MNIEIHKANIADYQAIHSLNCHALGYDYPIEKTKLKIEKVLRSIGDMILVAEIDKKPVGYIHLENYECTYSDNLKNILAIAVDGDFRQNGIGRLLIAEAELWAKSEGACGIRLVSGHDRVDAHKFYVACGYHLRKEQKNFIKFI